MRLIGRVVRLASAIALLSAHALAAQAGNALLRDDRGRTIEVPGPPRRVVCLVPAVTEIFFALGAEGVLVGRSAYADHPAGVRKIPSVGEAIRPSVELVVARRPDLVILVGGADNAPSVEALERVGIRTYVVVLNDLVDLRRTVLHLGRLLDREEKAAELWDRIERSLAAVAAAVRGRPRKSVYYDVAFPPAITIGRGSYLDTLLVVAGGRNVFHDLASPSPRVSIEAIATRDPDLVIYPRTRTSPTALPPDLRPGWHAVRAVREGRVRVVDGDLLHRLGPRIGEAARELARVLHPRAFPDAREKGRR